MIILAENCTVELAFNKILKEDYKLVFPLLVKLNENKIEEHILEQRFLEMFDQNYECFSIGYNGKIIGFFGLWFLTRHYAGRMCEPDHIYIEAEFQGKGIGRKLFKFIEDYASKKDCIATELNSYVSNFRSHKFYMNEGYVIKGYHFLKKL